MASRDAAAPRPRAAETLDGAAIEQATGLKGAFDAAHAVFKVTAPRTDVAVLVDGRALEPFLGLTSWAGFLPGTKAPCMVMGDLVLFQDEVNPVMSAALDHGLTVTALHNHFFDDEPRVYFMHIGGEGTQDALARGVRAALDQVRHVRGGHPTPGLGSRSTGVPSKSAIPADKIDAILATKGTVKDGMYKAVFGREVGLPCGCSVGKDMGVNTWVAMGGDAEHALVDGDFLTFEGELQPVLKALRHAGIDIVAIHSHMEGEAPKALFLHYWGVGRAEDLAHGVKSALDLLGR
ncbi:MAG: DUF1259 domain-containing protein [Planctomycetes bacterium]|nr:DUF1259 domain-containing protein [Planctomycetota bacterium]